MANYSLLKGFTPKSEELKEKEEMKK